MLKSRRQFPPGHFSYFQPQTGWSAPLGLTFDQVVAALIKHRIANPRFDLSTEPEMVAKELDEYTCLRLGNDPNYCSSPAFFPSGEELKKKRDSQFPFRGPDLGGVAAAAKQARNTVAGIGLYLEWFGQAGPVAQEQANRRAEVCLGCPKHNTKLTILQRFNEIASKPIMQALGILNDLELHTPSDDKLGVCEACDCPIRAKVWCPIGVITNHIRPEAKAALAENCWIRSESRDLTKT